MKKKRISKEQLGWVPYAELQSREVLDRANQKRRVQRADELKAIEQREEDRLRVNRFKARKERRLAKTSNKIIRRFKWNEAVCLLTGSISEAIWHEGGQRDDAMATAELVYHAICRDLHARFDGRKNILPFKRNKDYFKKKVSDG